MISDLCVVGQAQPRRLHLLCPLSRMHKAPFTLLRQAYRSRQGAGAGKDSGGLVEGRGPGGPLSALPSSLLASPGGRARLAPGSGPLCPPPHHCLTNTPQLLAHEACQGPLDLSPLPFKASRLSTLLHSRRCWGLHLEGAGHRWPAA